MEGILPVLVIIVVISIGIWLFRIYGYRDGVIRIELDERYFDRNEFIIAVKSELEKRGMEVRYKGDGMFDINGSEYSFQEVNHPIAGIPVQRALLEKVKSLH